MFRYTWLLLLIGLAISLYATFLDYTSRLPGHWKISSNPTVFPMIDSHFVQKIILTSGHCQTILRKKDVGWQVEYRSPSVHILDWANRNEIGNFIQYLTQLCPNQAPSKIQDIQSWQQYGLGNLDIPGNSIQIECEKIANVLYFGFNLASETETYARLQNSEYLLRLPIRCKEILLSSKKNPHMWRNGNLFPCMSQFFPRQWEWQENEHSRNVYLTTSASTENRYLLEEKGNLDRVRLDAIDYLQNLTTTIQIQQFTDGIIQEASCFPKLGYTDGIIQEYVYIGSKVSNNVPNARYVVRHSQIWGESIYATGIILYNHSWEPRKTDDWRERFAIDTNIRVCEQQRVGKIQTIERLGSICWTLQCVSQGIWKTKDGVEISLDKVQEFFQKIDNMNVVEFSQNLSIPNTLESLRITTLDKNYTWQWFRSPDGILWWKEYNETVWRKLSNNIQFLDATHLYFYNNRVDAFVFADVLEVEILHCITGKKKVFRKHTDTWTANILDVLRNSAWIMADVVLGEEKDRQKFACTLETAEYVATIRTSQITRTFFIGKPSDNGMCAIFFSDFPYIYGLGPALFKSIEKAFN